MLISKFKYPGSSRVGNGTMKTAESAVLGTMLAFNTDGTMEPIDDVADYKFAGIAKHTASAEEAVETEYGQVFFYPYASAAQGDVGEAAYASGDQTLAKSSSNSVYVGMICDVEVGVGWWIDPLYPQNLGTTSGSDDWSRDGTAVRPKNAGDSIETDDPASAAEILELDDNKISAAGTGTNIDILLIPKGTGVVTNGTDPLLPYKVSGQATTGTGGTVGQVAATGVTSSAVIICTGAEAGADVAYVVAGTDLFTVFDASDSEIDAKKVNYIILSY